MYINTRIFFFIYFHEVFNFQKKLFNKVKKKKIIK